MFSTSTVEGEKAKRKYSITTVILDLLISLLICSTAITSVRASPRTGLDTIREGATYDFKRRRLRKITYKDYKLDEEVTRKTIYKATKSLKIDEVNEDEGWIAYRTIKKYRSHVSVDKKDTLSVGLRHADKDMNGLPEYMIIDLWYEYPIIAGTWSSYIEPLNELKDRLVKTEQEYVSFDYSLVVSNESQEIELTADYVEDHPHPYGDIDEEQVPFRAVYQCHFEVTLDFDDFVISEYKVKYNEKISRIVNEDFVEKEGMVLATSYERVDSLVRQGFFAKYGLWIGISVGVAGVIVVTAVLWKKGYSLVVKLEKKDE